MGVLATLWIRTGFTACLRKPINSTSLPWKKNGFRSMRRSMPTENRHAWGRLRKSQHSARRAHWGFIPARDWWVLSSQVMPKTRVSLPMILLENLAAKVTAAHSLGSLLNALKLSPEEIDFVISCSEEAVGDRYNRGGGNLAKAIAEEVGCANASGSDVKAFCAGPLYAMIHGASLIQSGVCNRVAVVAGGSLAKLGMKFESHLKKGMPILEDVLGSFAVILSAAKTGEPCVRLDSAAFHPVRGGASPQAMAESLAEKALAKLGMKLTDVDRYAVELHNPEITVPSGSGDVPRTNYLTLAALAVMRGQIKKDQMEDFVRTRGMLGYAPTQGHIPSAIVYLGHALDALRNNEIKNALFISKGSLFLGRMTQLSDGCSFLVEKSEK